MAVYSIKTEQIIPASLSSVWDFFSNPANLLNITPASMNFRVISKHHGALMYPGQIIEYTVSPVLGIPLYWMTEITHVQAEQYFIDEQRFGPYRLWHHQHHFKQLDNGVAMTDIVHYKIPFWLLGDLAHALFIKKQLQEIFRFRYQKTEELFGKIPSQEFRIQIA